MPYAVSKPTIKLNLLASFEQVLIMNDSEFKLVLFFFFFYKCFYSSFVYINVYERPLFKIHGILIHFQRVFFESKAIIS